VKQRHRRIVGLALRAWVALAAGCSDDGSAPTAGGAAPRRPAAAARVQFRVQPIVDEQQGGLVVATITVPQSWTVQSRVVWKYEDASHPVRAAARAEAPDGSAWVEYFPNEVFYWLEPVRSPVPVGGRSLGMIHAPNIRLPDAMRHFVIAPYRGRMERLEVVGTRPVRGLPEAFHLPPSPGEAMAVRLRYVVAGHTVDEDVYGMLGSGNRIPYTGPQGTWYESHRPLVLTHAVGAIDGKLDGLYPLLGFIATSVTIDPAWEAHRQQVMQQLSVEFNRMIARGYAQIQAAAQLSRTISANSDAMLASIEAQRKAQAQRDAARRAASAESRSPSDEFSLYIRGTERMKDPYRGESEQSYQQRYHWTDGSGNYRSSNDPSFNPNVGVGGGVTWQRMEPAGR
jgi:hypothetical protein